MQQSSISVKKPVVTTALMNIFYLTFFCIAGLFFLLESPFGIPRNVFAITYASIALEAFSFMLIGSLVSGLVEVFIPKSFIEKVILGNRYGLAAWGGAMGLIFPVCECAIVPIVRRLFKKGLPFSAGIAFLLAGPIVNPIVIWSTIVAYQGNWVVVISRTLFGYGIAVTVGIVAGSLFSAKDAIEISDTSAHSKCGCGHDHDHSHEQDHRPLLLRINDALLHARDDFFDVGRYLIVGTFIAAVVRSSMDVNIFDQVSGLSFITIPAMMFLAFILNLCSEADAFVAVSFRGLVPIAGQLAFMIFGPMLDVKQILMYRSIFNRKFIIFMVTIITVLVFVYSLFFAHFIETAALL